jgi:hypothetical protein
MRCLAQRPHSLLVVTFFNNNGHAARLKADLLMNRTYNKGLTNPEYGEYSTRLTRLRKRLQGHVSFRESRYGYSRIKNYFVEKLTKVSPCFQHFIVIIDGSLTNSK